MLKALVASEGQMGVGWRPISNFPCGYLLPLRFISQNCPIYDVYGDSTRLQEKCAQSIHIIYSFFLGGPEISSLSHSPMSAQYLGAT